MISDAVSIQQRAHTSGIISAPSPLQGETLQQRLEDSECSKLRHDVLLSGCGLVETRCRGRHKELSHGESVSQSRAYLLH